MHPLLNIAISAARQAGDIINRHVDQLERIKITQKGKGDFFSDVDVKAEQAIIQTIRKAYPAHGIIAEESGVQNDNAETVWIIDPLDGTGNYLHGFPYYAVSIAVVIKNRVEHGVIYDPLRHECFIASRGVGARLNDRRIRVSKQTQLSDAMLASSCSSRLADKKLYMSVFSSLFEQHVTIRRMGSAALDLAYVAAGRLDGCFGVGMNSWDIAAGCLFVQEAGGFISDFNGEEDYLQHGNLIAGSPKIFKSLLQAVNEKVSQ